METENRQADIRYDMIFMLGGLWEVCPFFVIGCIHDHRFPYPLHNTAYKKPFRYLSYDKDGYSLKEGARDQLFLELLDANIPYSIEQGVSLQSCEEVLLL